MSDRQAVSNGKVHRFQLLVSACEGSARCDVYGSHANGSESTEILIIHSPQLSLEWLELPGRSMLSIQSEAQLTAGVFSVGAQLANVVVLVPESYANHAAVRYSFLSLD